MFGTKLSGLTSLKAFVNLLSWCRKGTSFSLKLKHYYACLENIDMIAWINAFCFPKKEGIQHRQQRFQGNSAECH